MDEEIQELDKTTVMFGSIIAIADFTEQSAYIFSDGFIKNTCSLKNFVYKDEEKKGSEGLDNNSFFKCLFQIIPRVSDTEKEKQILNLQEVTDKLKQRLDGDKQKFDHFQRYNLSDIDTRLANLNNEFKQNIDTIQKSKQTTLTYYQPFQLLHVASGKFLAIHEIEAQYENQNYRTQLDEFSSDRSVFKIAPSYKYQSFGEQDVNAEEMCVIVRAQNISNREAYLNASALEIKDLKYNLGATEKTGHILKREVNTSVEVSHSWKIVLFQQYIPDHSRILKVGDCIWLFHAEAEATLSVLKIQEAVDKQDFKFYPLEDWLSLQNLKVSAESVQEGMGNVNGLWQLEGAELSQGGLIQFDDGYYLKNIQTGYYLTVEARKGEDQSKASKLAKVKQLNFILSKDRKSLWEFVDLKTQPDQKYVRAGAYTYIKQREEKKWMDFKSGLQGYSPILKDIDQKTEHAVFKIHMATRNEVWEINFLQSCFRLLCRFLIQISQANFAGLAELPAKKKYIQKMIHLQSCIKDLEDFVNNKIYNTSPDQAYGEINSNRQKLLYEQYYIDILIKILDRLITKQELEYYQKSKDVDPDDQESVQKKSYVKCKVDLLNQIYQFLGSVCKNNLDNSNHTMDLIPYFQIHAKYLPKAVNTIIDIVSSNKQLLYKLSDGLKVEEEARPVDQMNILINLYDGQDSDQEANIPINKQEKITQKPVNMIEYFMKLIWDQQAINKDYYLKFLRNICTYRESPIQINQENIYKFYKIFNDAKPILGVETKAEEVKSNSDIVRLMSRAGLLIIPAGIDISDNKFMQIVEQLTFFSEVAVGRNLRWKKELGAQFEKSFLFRNIWNQKQLMDQRYQQLQPCFAKLALSLYIDQDPLIPRRAPVLCQLFSECDKAKDYQLFKSAVNENKSNLQELNTYHDLLENLLVYFSIERQKVQDIVQDDANVPIGHDFFNLDELLLNSAKILAAILKLELFWVLDYSHKEYNIQPRVKISELVYNLMYLFQYEKFELQFVKAHVKTQESLIADKWKQKMRPNALDININFLKQEKQEEEEEESRSQQLQNEQSLYLNPVMRGYLKLQSQMLQLNYMDPIHIQKEIDLKIKICDIFEYLLDLRQDFLLQNTLVFFKLYILQGEHIENNEQQMRHYLRLHNKKNKDNRIHYDDLKREGLNKMLIKRVLREHQYGLLPNLASTGLKQIDEEDIQAGGQLQFFTNLIKKDIIINKTHFYNYIQELKLEGIPEVLDLDQYLSIAYQDIDFEQNCIAAILPTLLNSFTKIQDKQLEKRCLKLILRLFTQKEEYKQNLLDMQVIFDAEKQLLYQFLNANVPKLQQIVDRIDSWLEAFIQRNTIAEKTIFQQQEPDDDQEIFQCIQLIESMTNGLLMDISKNKDQLVANSGEIDPEKQKLQCKLKSYQPIINLVREGLMYFQVLEEDIPEQKKEILIKLFTNAFQYFCLFVEKNTQNQIIIQESLRITHLQFDLLQINLLQKIYQDNKQLLLSKVDNAFVNQFVNLIDKEGRQVRFLNMLESLMVYNGRYIFDNQLIILNAFIKQDQTQVKILYCDGSKQDLRFYLDDPLKIPDLPLFEKLQEINFKDTFRDEPFYYHIKLLDILIQTSLLTKDRTFDPENLDIKNNFNISVSKLKQLFSADYLLDILKLPDQLSSEATWNRYQKTQTRQNNQHHLGEEAHQIFEEQQIIKCQGATLMKPQVLEYLRLVHIQSERGQIQQSQLYNCQLQMEELFDFELKRVTLISLIPLELFNYYVDGLFPFMIAYYDRFLSQTPIVKNDNEKKKDLKVIENFLAQFIIKLIMQENQYVSTKLQAQCIQTALKCYPPYKSREFDENYQKFAMKLANLIKPPLDPDIPIETKPLKSHGKHGKKRKIKRQHFDLNKIFNQNDSEEDELLQEGYNDEESVEVNQFWKFFIEELTGNEVYNKEEEKERSRIASAIVNISLQLKPTESKQVTNKPDIKTISTKLINFLQSAFKDPECQDTIIKLLRVLERIITSDSSQQVEMQKLFDKLGATSMVLVVLSGQTDKKLLMAFLQFINTMLKGGNIQVQSTIYSFVRSYPSAENIFAKFYQIIRKQIENLEIIAKSQKPKEQNTDANISQEILKTKRNDSNIDISQESPKKKGKKHKSTEEIVSVDENEFKEDLDLVNQILTFIQNAVEGHYLPLQNYLRLQENSKTNYDLINSITDLFKTYYSENRSPQNFDNMLKCLDTLNELVQGPCPDNQLAISESKFLDISSDMLQLRDKKDKLDQWMLARLKNKILSLVLSLLEGREMNTNNNVLKRIMRNLPIQILEDQIMIEYSKYKKYYKGAYTIEALQHMDGDPRSESKGHHSKHKKKGPYYETILQNGFLIVFLIQSYLESDPGIITPIVRIHKQYKKEILKIEENNFMVTFFKESFVYMMWKFIRELIDAFFGTLNQVSELAQTANKAVTGAVAGVVSGRVVPALQRDIEEEKKQEEEESKKKNLKEAMDFYLTNSAHIDVVHDGNIEIVYFIKLPLTKFLLKEYKLQFHEEVDRSTTQSKVSGLVSQAPEIIEICKHEGYLDEIFQKNKIFAAFTKNIQLFRELAWLMTLFLNVFILFSFDAYYGDRITSYILFNIQGMTPSATKSIVLLLGIVMTVLSLFVVSYFLLKRAPLIIKRGWMKKGLFDDFDPNPVFQLADVIYKAFLIILAFLMEIEVMYYIAYGVFAILGTFYHPFFFIFHLSEILFRYPSLQNIVKSVYNPRIQLILTIFLFVYMVYIFTIIQYVSFSDYSANYCDVLLYCWLINIEYSFRGAIGDYIRQDYSGQNYVPFGENGYGVGRFFFNEVSAILLGNIMLNIIAGIIIDKFGQLREDDQAKMDDIEQVCFICGKEKAEFDRMQSKEGGGFREHIKINHYMWNYLYFIAYLNWKNPQDYSGMESFVDQKIKEEDLGWVPINQARELRGLDEDDSEKSKELISEMQEKLKYIGETIKLIDKNAKILKAK